MLEIEHNNTKNHYANVRLNDEEYDYVMKVCNDLKCTKSEAIRAMIRSTAGADYFDEKNVKRRKKLAEHKKSIRKV